MYDQCHFFVNYDQITTTKYQTLHDAQQQNSELRLEKNEKSRFVLNVKRPFV